MAGVGNVYVRRPDDLEKGEKPRIIVNSFFIGFGSFSTFCRRFSFLLYYFTTIINLLLTLTFTYLFIFFRYNDDKSRGHSLHPWLHLPPPRLVSPVSAPR